MLLPSAWNPSPRSRTRSPVQAARIAATPASSASPRPLERGAQRVELLAQIARADGADDPPA